MKGLELSHGLTLGLVTITTLYVAALPCLKREARNEPVTALEIDGAPARDLEVESMRARIADLEADLVAREQDCEDLANALNSAIADRNEAVAILMANGWVPTEDAGLTEGRAR